MNATLFSTITRSVTLAFITLGLAAATVYQFVANGQADAALLGATTGLVGAFTGAHINLLGAGAATTGAGQSDTTPPEAAS